MNSEQKEKWGNTYPSKDDWIMTEDGPSLRGWLFGHHQGLLPIPITVDLMHRINEAEYISEHGYFSIDLPESREMSINFFGGGRIHSIEFEDRYLWAGEWTSHPTPHLHWLQQQCRLLGLELTIHWKA